MRKHKRDANNRWAAACKTSRLKLQERLLVGLVIFHILFNIVWLRLDSRGDNDFGVGFAAYSIDVYEFLKNPSRMKFEFFVRDTQGKYPPFFFVVTSVVYSITGSFHPDIAVATNLIFLAVTLMSTYKIGERLFDANVGILASYLMSMYPIAFGLSRVYFLDYGLLSMVSLSMWFLVASDFFSNRKYSILLGVSFALGTLTKLSYPMFTFVPLVYCILVGLYRSTARKDSPTLIVNTLLFTSIALILSLWWILPNLDSISFQAQWHSVQKQSGWRGYMTEVRPLEHLKNAWLNMMLPVLFIFSLYAVSMSIIRLDSAERIIIPLWLVSSHILLSGPISEISAVFRYSMPYLPSVAILSAAGLYIPQLKRIRAALIMMLVIFTATQFFYLSFFSENMSDFRTSDWSSPRRDDWQIERTIQVILEHSTKDRLKVGVISEHERFHPLHFKYYAMRNNLDLDFGYRSSTWLQSMPGDVTLEELLDRDFIVLKNSEVGYRITRVNDEDVKKIIGMIEESGKFIRIDEAELPDKTASITYMRKG